MIIKDTAELVVAVLGLVELSRRAGLVGRVLLLESFVIGLVLGILYQCSIAIPTDFAGWFAACLYGIGLGLTASGVNDWAKRVFSKQETTLAGGGETVSITSQTWQSVPW